MRTFLKVVSLVLVAVFTFMIAIYNDKEPDFVRISTMNEATLPVVYMNWGELRYNELHGYTGEMDMESACQWVTVLPDDRKLHITIDKYNAQVREVSYEVRSIDGSNLYEDTVIKEYEDKDGVIEAVLNIKNLLEENEDYILKINIATANFEEVSYYTRIRYDGEASLEHKVELIKKFNTDTFDRENLSKNIRKYIESSGSADNTNHGKIDITSSLEMFGYGTLSVERESEPTVSLVEISGVDAILCLDFRVSTIEDGNRIYYDVREKYTITEGKSGMYLMDYERTMNQEFVMKGAVKSTSRIYIGISPEGELTYAKDENERYTAFVRNGELFSYDVKSNRLTSIFTFEDNETDNKRERYAQYDIKIIRINEDGDIVFAVYGYMNRGLHEGKVGVSVCNYDASTTKIKEIRFVPVSCTFETLKENFGDIAYADDKHTITLMINETIYAMDTESHENTIIIDNLKKGEYSVSSDGLKIAYVRDNIIRIYSLVEQKQKVIECNAGEKIKNIGYIDNDFIYGVAKVADIVNGKDGNDIFPMHKVYIINDQLERIKEYGISGVYVTGYEIVGNRVTFERMKYNEENVLVTTDIDQLMNKNDNATELGTEVKQIATSARCKELYLLLSRTVSDAHKVELAYAGRVIFDDTENNNITHIADTGTENVFDRAHMFVKCNASTKEIAIATKTCEKERSLHTCLEIVLGYLGKAEDIDMAFANGEDAVSLIDAVINVDGYNLTGWELDEVLGFSAMGSLVITRISYNEYVIITGYTRSGVNVYNPVTGKTKSYTKTELRKLVSGAGDVFVTYY